MHRYLNGEWGVRGKCEEEPLGMPGNGTKRRSTSNGQRAWEAVWAGQSLASNRLEDRT